MMPEAHPIERRLYQFDELVVDPVRRLLLRHGEPVQVTPKALSLLMILLERHGDVVSKSEIIAKVWPDTFVTEANLTQNISFLRKALGERAEASRYIVTVPGQGYSFVGEVREVAIEGAATAEIEILAAAASEALSSSAPFAATGRLLRGRLRTLVVALLLLVSLALGIALWRSSRIVPPAPSEPAGAPQGEGDASSEATRLYDQGLAQLGAYDPQAARDDLARAAQLDPGSALIHSALSQAWADLGYDVRAATEARRALDLAGPLSREQRLEIEGRLYVAGRQWGRAAETYGSLWTFFPERLEYGLRVVSCLNQAGKGKEALAVVADLRKLPPPGDADPRIDLAEAMVARRLSDMTALGRAAVAAAAKGRATGKSLIVGRALLLAGSVPLYTGRPRDALAPFEEARATFAKADYRWGVAMAAAHIGLAYRCRGDFARAEAAHREALAVSQAVDNIGGIAGALADIGVVYQGRGDLPQAMGFLARSRSQFAEIDDPNLKAWVLGAIAAVHLAQGNLDGARQEAEDVFTASHRAGDRPDEAQALTILASVQALRGSLAEARGYNDRALGILGDVKDPAYANPILVKSIDILARIGDLAGARSSAEQALAAARETGDRIGTAQILGALSGVSLRTGDLAAAGARAEEQLRIGREIGARGLTAEALQGLGRAALAGGDLAGARKALEESLRTSDASGAALRAQSIRLDLARLDLAGGAAAAAVPRARELADWFAARGMEGEEARSLAVLAEALDRQGNLSAAHAAAALARTRSDRAKDVELRFEVAVRLARIDAEEGDALQVLAQLEATAREALRRGFVPASLEARLAAAEIEVEWLDPVKGLAGLQAVRREAQSRELGLIARRAETLIRSRSTS